MSEANTDFNSESNGESNIDWLDLVIEWADELAPDSIPAALDDSQIQQWVSTALIHLDAAQDCDLSIRMVHLAESQQLNADYRGKDKPTNVLSFPSDLPEEMAEMIGYRPLGDLVICWPVVQAEAAEQQKAVLDHLCHLTVHGVLHLLGYDHETSDADAEEMEALEVEILEKLAVGNPY